MPNKLYIDLEKCRQCRKCTAQCSYYYHPYNDGILYLREIAEFAVTCRHCEEAPCIRSCPTEALEREGGIVRRHNIRCVSCKSCTLACPFGTLLPELVPYAVSRCDACLGRLGENESPVCLAGCPEEAIAYGAFEADPKAYRFAVGEHLIVHSMPWKKEDYK
ncbi:4Fe-4S ferredoxin [bacterium]|nr:4Fe-4S ferredoxin [bacterium]